MTARVVQALPEGPDWLYEVKLDGYRALLLKHGSHVQLRSRNDKNLVYPEVERAAMRLNAKSVVLDGEIVALDEKGHPSFQALQHRGGAGKVRAGFTPHLRRDVHAVLQPMHVARCPFVDLPNSKTSHWGAGVTAEEMAEMQWVKPKAVAQIRFVEWTADGHLRHAAFLGLRGDKNAVDVKRET